MRKIHLDLVIYRYEVLLVIIILLLTGSIAMSSREPERVFPPVQRYPYRIALTFDDGPHPFFTESLITELAREDIHATFFVVGSQVTLYPFLAKRIALSGNEIESHTYTHTSMIKLTPEEIRQELTRSMDVIRSATGRECLFFRPPGGRYDHQVLETAKSLGLNVVLWSILPKDHEENDVHLIVSRVLSQARDGGIILMHSGRFPTLQALPLIIRTLKERGYRFVTISELYGPAGKKQGGV